MTNESHERGYLRGGPNLDKVGHGRDMTELSLFGGFGLSVGGDGVPGISVGSQRVLACVALGDRVVTHHQVAGMLWPEATDERAEASLRSALSLLEAPARQVVRVTAVDLGVAEGVVVDVHQSRGLARRLIDHDASSPESDIGASAVSDLSKDLLPGWYDDWALIAAADWRRLRLYALEAVAARLTVADRLEEAAAAALAAVVAEPLRERSRAALVGVHIAEGNESDAVAEFERYRVLLLAELGLEPTSRLRRLLFDLEPGFTTPRRWPTG